MLGESSAKPKSQPAAHRLLVVLAAATAYAVAAITVSLLTRTDTSQSMVVWFLVIMAIGAGLLAIPGWVPLQLAHAPLIAGMGLAGALGQIALTKAFQLGEASMIAPLEYSGLVWVIGWDLAFWGQLPDGYTWAGAAIIVASGLYLLHRERVEAEYASLYTEYGMGTTTFSPLASGILTGKYNAGFPDDARLGLEGMEWLQSIVLGSGDDRIERARRFTALAAEMGVAPATLAIAWCLRNPHVSSVILGASRPEQLLQNLDALELGRELGEDAWARVEATTA